MSKSNELYEILVKKIESEEISNWINEGLDSWLEDNSIVDRTLNTNKLN